MKLNSCLPKPIFLQFLVSAGSFSTVLEGKLNMEYKDLPEDLQESDFLLQSRGEFSISSFRFPGSPSCYQ